MGRDGRALYFSRSPIPYDRGGGAVYFKHIGLYVYRREFLLDSIAAQEQLAVTDAEIGEELGKLLSAGGRVAQEFRALSPEQRRSRVRDVLERRKVFDFLLEHAQVSEEKASNESTLVAGA